VDPEGRNALLHEEQVAHHPAEGAFGVGFSVLGSGVRVSVLLDYSRYRS
jgi:hypothetical protein